MHGVVTDVAVAAEGDAAEPHREPHCNVAEHSHDCILCGCCATGINSSCVGCCSWHLRRGFLPIAPISDLEQWLVRHNQRRASGAATLPPVVRWYNATVWMAGSLPNLYDVWNDLLLPLGAAAVTDDTLPTALRLLFTTPTPLSSSRTLGASLTKGSSPHQPRKSVAALTSALQGWLHSVAADAEVLLEADDPLPLYARHTDILTADERSHRGSDTTRNDTSVPTGEGITTVTCYNSVHWVGPSAVLSTGAGHRIVAGDGLRQSVSVALKASMLRYWGLCPYPPPYNDDVHRGELGAWWKEWCAPGRGWLSSIVTYMHVPSPAELRRTGPWRDALAESTGVAWGGALGGCQPRLLLILRNQTRRVADGHRILAVAQSVGFHAAVLVAETTPATEQAHAARYADVLVGVHGQGLTWMVLMDGVSVPRCRFVVELRHYGRKLRGVHNVYEQLAADQQLRYLGVPPDDVSFDPLLLPAWRLPRARLRLARKTFPQSLPEFDAQVLHYDLQSMTRVLQQVHRQVSQCVCLGMLPPSTAASWELEYSGVVGGG